jgi:hypothetical protein
MKNYTIDCSDNDGSVLEFDGDGLILELHKESTM